MTTPVESSRRQATRMSLVLAAEEEFGKRGVDATSVEQLCEAAGFTRGAFYSNFATKDDLCVAIAEHFATQTIDACHSALEGLPQAATLENIVTSILGAATLTENQHRTHLELQLRSWRDPELGGRMDVVRQRTLPLAADVVQQAARQSELALALDSAEVIGLFEALFFSPTLAREGSTLRLITTLITCLTKEQP